MPISTSLPSFEPPPIKFVQDLMRPFRQYFAPRYYGMEEFDASRPALFIGNHTIYGMTDGFFLGSEMYEKQGLFIRALVDNMHNEVPLWRDMVSKLGFIPASREVCETLMREGNSIMVFPGGARETCKQKGEQYTLTWKKRVGFARMAIQNGYDIVPVAGLGGDDLYKIIWDSQDIMASPFGKFLKFTGFADKFLKGGENIPPIAKGIGFTGLPKPERLYISIGKRIETTRFAGKEEDETALFDLREEVETSMYQQLDDLKAYRNNDEDEEWWRKLLKNI